MKYLIPALFAALSTSAVQAQPALFDPADFGKIVIAPRQLASGLQFEQAIGDYQNEPVTSYGVDGPAVRMGRPIGRLDLLYANGNPGVCTAFLVDEEYILTNHHCVPRMDGDPTGAISGVSAIQLVMGYVTPGQSAGADRYTVSTEIVETNRALDYTVLRVFGNPAEKYGTLELTGEAPESGEFLWIIGHPEGQSQHISREGCAAASPAVSEEGRLVHTCDTLPGNSGSPVIRLTDRRVVGLHHAGDSRTGFNYAIPMTQILEVSQVLKAGAPAVPATVGDACTVLWSEARELGCAGFETYLNACGDHGFAELARSYMEQSCQSAEVPAGAVVTLKADGSGDFTTLSEAIAASEAGGRIEIHPGIYKGGLTVDKPVELVGVGDRSQIIVEGGRADVLRWVADGGLISNLTIRQVGGNVTVDFDGGSALLEKSDLTSTGGAIITIRSGANPTIRDNLIHNGAAGGIFVYDRGRGVIEGNDIYDVQLAAIEVRGESDPEVTGNTLRDTRNSGLYIWDYARGTYAENLIEGHALAGVAVQLGADPVVRGNTIQNGQGGGLYIHNGAKGLYEGNTVTGNTLTGVEVKDRAVVVFTGNRIEGNRMSGIWVRDGAGGRFENNDLRGNGNGGIAVEPNAGPVETANNRE